MNIKRSRLEEKSNKELEEYIKEGNKFVPEATIYAYEILKSRGRQFSDIETERVNLIICNKNKKKEIIIDPFYKKAANIIYLSAAVGLLIAILTPESFSNGFGIIKEVFYFGIILSIGYIVSNGNASIKYVLLILALIGTPFVLFNIVNNLTLGIIILTQAILQIYAIILLFRVKN